MRLKDILAAKGRRVVKVPAKSSVADAIRNARANGIDNCTFLAGEVRHVLPTLVRDGVRASVVVADPPRAGFHPKALSALAAYPIAHEPQVGVQPDVVVHVEHRQRTARRRKLRRQPVDQRRLAGPVESRERDEHLSPRADASRPPPATPLTHSLC